MRTLSASRRRASGMGTISASTADGVPSAAGHAPVRPGVTGTDRHPLRTRPVAPDPSGRTPVTARRGTGPAEGTGPSLPYPPREAAWRPMPGHVRRGDATRPSIRARVGHVLGYGKGPMAVTVRRIGRVRATARMTMANPGRPVLHERRQAGAWLRPESGNHPPGRAGGRANRALCHTGRRNTRRGGIRGNHPPDIRAGIWVYRGLQVIIRWPSRCLYWRSTPLVQVTVGAGSLTKRTGRGPVVCSASEGAGTPTREAYMPTAVPLRNSWIKCLKREVRPTSAQW